MIVSAELWLKHKLFQIVVVERFLRIITFRVVLWVVFCCWGLFWLRLVVVVVGVATTNRIKTEVDLTLTEIGLINSDF